jgi:6-pyruvoyltetrahydropterin/6-carboxytetrahydropterin synthase
MAHALYGHDGLCKNIHGHTYTLHITLLGIPINDFENPKDGMVIDFTDLKKIVKENILSIYDHALVLNGDSTHGELKDLSVAFEKVIFFEQQPTCENLVISFAAKLLPLIPEKISLFSLKLEETPTSFAEWYADDN